MTALVLAAPVVAFLLLAAHFFRADNPVVLAISVLAIVLIFVRRPWSAPHAAGPAGDRLA